ncbi:MAG TPA: hypothetical protein VED41_08630 [Solirubrobacteraceae bacterium]|nr:hypothetical protein [Solirubrobacteraceae bacterium]
MSGVELADLDRDLARGPLLVHGAAFGASVGAIIGWLRGERGVDFLSNVAQGAGAGAALGLASYGFWQWVSGREHEMRCQRRPEFRSGLAPYPLYRPSLSYPWSEH